MFGAIAPGKTYLFAPEKKVGDLFFREIVTFSYGHKFKHTFFTFWYANPNMESMLILK